MRCARPHCEPIPPYVPNARARGSALQTPRGSAQLKIARRPISSRAHPYGLTLGALLLSGLVFDSSIQSQLILLHQRFPANRELRAFASSLLRALPQPHVAIFLELSAEVAASRTRVLSVEALRKLEPKYAELSAQLRGEGSLIFRRDWTQFGAANSVRDAILSSPPSQGFNWARSLAPPSEAASERMLEDMLAAAKAVVTHKEIPNAKTEGRAVSPISPAAVADLSLA